MTNDSSKIDYAFFLRSLGKIGETFHMCVDYEISKYLKWNTVDMTVYRLARAR